MPPIGDWPAELDGRSRAARPSRRHPEVAQRTLLLPIATTPPASSPAPMAAAPIAAAGEELPHERRRRA